MISKQNRAVLLARVSSKTQEEEGYSLNAQESLLQEHAKNKQLRTVKIFKIAETASKQLERKTFQELLTYLNDGNADHLIVEKTDRLTRNLKDAVSIDDWLEKDENHILHLVKEHSEIHKKASSDVKFMWTIHLAVAKKYTDNLREEVAKGTKQKLAEGWLPGKPPVGYMTVGDTGKRTHVIDPATAPLVKKMFDMYLEPSTSTDKLARDMSELGLKTKYGKALSRSHIQKTLQNPFYIGVNRWCDVDYPNGLQEHLISKETFEAVQRKRIRKNVPKYSKHNPDYKGLFSCRNCKGLITWELQKGRWYGHCNSYRKYMGCPKQKWIREDYVEGKLLTLFDDLICPSPAIMEWVKNALRARHESTMHLHATSTDLLRSQLDTITRKKDILYEDRLSERIVAEAYDRRYKELLQEEANTKHSLDTVDDFSNRQFEHGMKILELSQKASEVFPSKSPEQKRIILSRLFSNLSIDGPTLDIELSSLALAIADKVKIHKELETKFEPTKNNPNNRGRIGLESQLKSTWLGWRDSNPRMLVPETSALPLGDTPRMNNSSKRAAFTIAGYERFFNGLRGIPMASTDNTASTTDTHATAIDTGPSIPPISGCAHHAPTPQPIGSKSAQTRPV
ncbi:MAG: Recombinase [Candidatus Saccharibacteria bacterium GW2011_GWC2_48_9]|nr:MAG: Recombinase [Candidatus Saccharibacteria bacterium GW2011_GWC2_48_9]